jgi:hypothetical protein
LNDRAAAHDGVEGVSGRLVLRGGDGGDASSRAAGQDLGRSTTGRAEPLADKASDDTDGESAPVREISLVGGDKGSLVATVQTLLENDGGVRAGAQVQRRSLLPQVVSGLAFVVLLIALRYASGESPGVGGVGACVVLLVARTAPGGVDTDKGIAVDREGTVADARDDRRSSGAESASKELDIDS